MIIINIGRGGGIKLSGWQYMYCEAAVSLSEIKKLAR